MTKEELEKGIGVPVSYEAYPEFDYLYLSQFDSQESFYKYIRAKFPSEYERKELVRFMERKHKEIVSHK